NQLVPYRRRRRPERPGDVLVAEAPHQELEDLPLARGEVGTDRLADLDLPLVPQLQDGLKLIERTKLLGGEGTGPGERQRGHRSLSDPEHTAHEFTSRRRPVPLTRSTQHPSRRRPQPGP